MITFYSVTAILFKEIRQILISAVKVSSIVVGAAALVFCVVVVINIYEKGINKKFFINNNKYILFTLLLLATSCLFSSNKMFIKFNFLTVVVCLAIILIKTTNSKKQIKRAGKRK